MINIHGNYKKVMNKISCSFLVSSPPPLPSLTPPPFPFPFPTPPFKLYYCILFTVLMLQ